MYKQFLTLIFTFLLFSLTSAGLWAQKKYVKEGEKPEILKPEMRVTAWLNDETAVLQVGGPFSAPSYIELNAKTGKQKPYEGDPYSLMMSRMEAAAVAIVREGDVFYRNEEGKTVQLTNTGEEEQNPLLSPDKKYVAFTRNNNLYTIRIADRKETPLTFDGSDVILNGYASLVYEEDVLTGGYRTFWWSPDSKYIAFYRFDDSQVPVATLTDICPMPEKGRASRVADVRDEKKIRYDYQHIKVETYRYSKPGDKNADVRVGIANPEGGNITWADFKAGEDCYFGDPYWRPDSKGLWVQWLNRGQDSLFIYNVYPETGKKEVVYHETQKTWVMINCKHRVRFLPSGKGAIIASDKSGWDQLYLYDLNGKLINRITNGDYKVLDVMHVDEKNKTLYFTCFKDNVACTDLYKVNLDGKNLKRLTFGNYSHKVEFSPDIKYFITTYCNSSTPDRVALLTTNGKLITELYDRKGADFDQYELDKNEIITVKSDDGKFDIPMTVRWPAGMKKGEKYPLYVRIYGGPNMMWMTQTYFSNNAPKVDDDKVILVFMDHRGSGLCGKVGADYIHRNLGYWELKDYTACVKWLVENGQADAEKVFIQGHSYGGFMTCYALTMGADVFKFGIAGAPVTDWLFYNTAYTERYMDSPDENPEGYKNSSVVMNADKFKGRLLIAHGMSDNNVHVQNTLQFVGELQRLNKQGFEMMIYPEDGHSLIGKHLNQYNALMKRFQRECFYGKDND